VVKLPTNIRANIGFDLITANNFSVMTIYERNKSENAYSDTLYLGFSHTPSEEVEYVMALDNDKGIFDYKRNINGFDIKVSKIIV